MTAGDGSPRRTKASASSMRDVLAMRTWEMELLISGALVFSLIRLPPLVSRGFDRLGAQLDEGLYLPLVLGQTYLQLGILTLAAALLIHLASRGLWVGLIGLDAVFSRGIRWRRLTTFGPRVKAYYRLRIPRLPVLIEKIDAFCNTIFSVAFATAILFFIFLFIVPILGVVSTVTDRLIFASPPEIGTFYVFVLLLFGPAIVVPLLDRKVAVRPRRRWLDALMVLVRPFFYLTAGPVYLAILLTLRSNVSRRAYAVGTAVIALPLMIGLMAAPLVGADVLQFNSRRYAPAKVNAHEMAPAHYESLRDAQRVYSVPSIEQAVASNGYVRLFLPYAPRWDNPLIAERCPRLEPLQAGGLKLIKRRNRPSPATEPQVREAIRCLGGLWTIGLDGESIDAGAFDFFRHPANGMYGLVGFLPVADLARGRHLLRLTTRIEPGDDPDGVRMYYIPFWT